MDSLLNCFGDSRLAAQRILDVYVATPTSQPLLRAELLDQLKALYEEKLDTQFLRWDNFFKGITCAEFLHHRNILLPGTAVTDR